MTVFRDLSKLHLRQHSILSARFTWLLGGKHFSNRQCTGTLANPAGREDGWGLPVTRLSSLHQFDPIDANGSQGRRQIKRGLVVMNSTAQALTQSEDDGLETLHERQRARDSMLSALFYNW